MSAVAIPDLYRTLLQPTTEYRLYNASPSVVTGIYGARFYNVPGCNDHFVDPQTNVRWPEPGVLPIRGYEYTQVEGKSLVEYKVTAREIVMFLCGDDGQSGKIGVAGVRMLAPGAEDETNEQIKAQARLAYEKKSYDDAGDLIAAFESENERRVMAKTTPKQPNARHKAAYRLRAEVESKGTASVMPFSCPRCYEGVKTAEALRGHIEELHSAFAQSLLKAAGLSAEEEVPAPVKRGPGRPRKVVAPAAA